MRQFWIGSGVVILLTVSCLTALQWDIVMKPIDHKGADLEAMFFWQIGLASFAVIGLWLLIRGLLTAKPPVALPSPPTSDTKDGADSPA